MSTSQDGGCSVVRDAVLRGALDEPAVVAHAEGCWACAVLLADAGLADVLAASRLDDEPLPDALVAAVAARVEAAHPPLDRWVRLGAVVLGLVGSALLYGAAAARPDLADLPLGLVAVQLGALSLAVALGSWLVARPPWRAELSAGQQAAALGVLWALPALGLVLPLSAPVGLGALAVPTLVCLGYGAVMVVLSVCVLGATFRSDTLLGARWPVAAATGAVLGNVALVLHCPVSDAGHVLAGHVSLGLLAAATAALASRLGVTPAGAAR